MTRLSSSADRHSGREGGLVLTRRIVPWVRARAQGFDAQPSASGLLLKRRLLLAAKAGLARPARHLLDGPASCDAEALGHEAQHRMANSVQIVATILKYSLRDATSAEARREIEAAYQRIMAVAELQRALFETKGMVAIAPYLEGLGRRIGSSLLIDGGNVSVRVECSPMTLDAATVTNIGLVVTELLINAIKHAFPDGRGGTIRVSFGQEGAGWCLEVADDGVGRILGGGQGLGSLIVPALALQLDAGVTKGQARSGTSILLIHPAGRAAKKGLLRA